MGKVASMDRGIIDLPSPYSVPETLARLESILKEYRHDPRPIYVRDVIMGKTISVLPGKK